MTYRIGDVQMTRAEFTILQAILDSGECLYCERRGLSNRYGSARRHRNACGRKISLLEKERLFVARLAERSTS